MLRTLIGWIAFLAMVQTTGHVPDAPVLKTAENAYLCSISMATVNA